MNELIEQNIVEDSSKIEKRIFIIRDVQVMLDSDVATLFGIETKNLNKAMKRNASLLASLLERLYALELD